MNHEGRARELRIKLFGGLAIEDGARQLGPKQLGGTRPTQVLEMLLAARGHRVSTTRIAELLWGAEPPANAAASIQTFISVLRRSLVRDRKRARELIVTERAAYRFATELVELDLDRFDRLVDRARQEPPWSARQTLADALALAESEVLEDDPYSEWAHELRQTYRLRVLDARLDAGELALAALDAGEALAHADAAAGLDQLSDRALRVAMVALYQLGRQHEALARYREFRRALDEQLGLTPSTEARELEAAILREEDPRLLVPRPLAAPAGAASAARSPLLGRSRELQSLRAAIRRGLDGLPTLVVLEGERGTGKTRLIEEVAGELTGVRVGSVVCAQLEQHLHYAPLAAAVRAAGLEADGTHQHALRPIFPELALAGSSSETASEVEALEALGALLGEHAPVVLMLDDLQFADPATIGALNYLRRRYRRLSASFIVTLCSEHTPAYHAARSLRADLSLSLAPLTADDLAPLGIPNLHEATGGNPRFVADILACAEDLQPSQALAQAILGQCAQEGPRAYRILLAASLLAPPFEPHQLESMLGLELPGLAEQLEVLCRRQILAIDGIGFRFRYQLVREVLLDNLSPARTQILRQRIAPLRLSEYRGT